MKIKVAFASVATIVVITLTFYGMYYWRRPFGDRVAYMRALHSALMNYANSHQNKFPETLEQLYPNFTSPTGKELAGLSGSIEQTVLTLQTNGRLGGNVTSWIYFGSGLYDTNHPEIALLAERKFGLSPRGIRVFSSKRSVVLISGRIITVSEEEWPYFSTNQVLLRPQAK
jgi:hypothetical protein